VSLCSVWDSLLWVCGSEFVLCLVQIGACLEIECLFCVWDSVQRVWGIDFFCVCERLGRVGGSDFVLCVGRFGVGMGE